jgi:hypothetical protein
MLGRDRELAAVKQMLGTEHIRLLTLRVDGTII